MGDLPFGLQMYTVRDAWKEDPEKKAEELLDIVGGAVKLGTVRGWIGQWKRGKNLPAVAKSSAPEQAS